MISLAGLSATYPGYEAAEDQKAKTDKTIAETQKNQTVQREAAIKLLGASVAGQALAGGAPGPQAPPPGQASVPAPRPMPLQGVPPPPTPQGAPPLPIPQGGPPPGPPMPPPQPQAAAPMGTAPNKLGFQDAIKRVLQASPQVSNHPEILLAALNHMKDLGILDPEAETQIADIHKQHTLNRIEAAKGHLDALKSTAPGAAAPPAAANAAPPPTATDPKTGAKVQWDGKAWTPVPPAT